MAKSDLDPSLEKLEVREASIEQPLFEGNSMNAFVSGGGLRVVSIRNTEGKLVGYGEAPDIREALEHAALDYSLGHESYKKQYSGKKARYLHYLTGAPSTPDDALDQHIAGGSNFDAFGIKETGVIVASLGGTHFGIDIPPEMLDRIVRTGKSETLVNENRGITYRVRLSTQFAGALTTDVIDNPNNLPAGWWSYTQTGEGKTLDEAVAAAFEAPEIDVPARG
jgi:hypothetical protein